MVMPVIKSAKKKLRQDKKRTSQNDKFVDAMKASVKEARKKPTAENIKKAFSATDKAAKKFVIHKNKAARLKAALAKLLAPAKSEASIRPTQNKKATTPAKKVAKTASKKAAKKSSKK